MNAVELLEELGRLDVGIAAAGGKLRLRARRGSLTPEMQERLRDLRADLLALLDPPPGPRPESSRDEVPLSAAQRQLWLYQRAHPDSTAYHIPLVLRLRGPLSQAVLEAALALVIRRHDSLRTFYPLGEEGPRQEVADSGPGGLPCCDLSGIFADAAQLEERRCLAAWAGRTFDLSAVPPIRLLLLRRSPVEHVLAVIVHHIAADGLSLQVVLEELDRSWGPLEGGVVPVLPPLELRYADFARWQHRHGTRPEVEERLELWRRELQAAQPPALPYDRPLAQGGPGPAATVRWPFPEGAALLAFAQRAGATGFAAALGLVGMLLARLGGTREVVVGTAVAGRPDPRLQGVVGLFADLVPLRLALAPGAGLAQILAAARREIAQAEARSDLPADRLMQARASLLRAVVVGGGEGSSATLGGLSLERIPIEDGIAKFDLTFGAALAGSAPELFAELDRRRFDPTTGERLLRTLRLLARRALAEPARPWETLPLLAAAERHAVLHEWSGGDPATTPPLIHRAVLARAAADPERPAVTAAGDAWTYDELVAAAREAARRLRSAGVAPEGRVAVLLPRGAPQIAACLGALLAGASYVPLDPGHPEPRLAFLLGDARAEALIAGADRSTPGSLPLARLPPPRRAPDPEPAEPPRALGSEDPARIAAVIYTSGSSGRPKGVMVPHGGLAELVAWQGRQSGLGPGSRVTHLAGLAFDAAAWEVWTALAHGATVVVPGGEERSDPGRLAPLLRRLEPAWSWVPTALMEVLLARDETLPRSGLWTGGDRLQRRPGRGRRPVSNAYGPTETTVVATAGPVAAGREIQRLPSLGRPAAAARVFVVDGRLAALPPGFEGELVIAGAGVARGYSGRPGRTAAVFVPDPLTGAAGGRLYRSGDRVRQRADGRFDFLGRLDSQLEVLGQRIEPGEVEAVLSTHPEVRQAAVAAPAVGGEPVLTAWVVGAASAEELRRWAAHRLPAGLCPAAYVPLERLPLNRNGKLDRDALPLPEIAGRPPRDLLEQQMVALWRRVLDRPAGRDTDLFAAGGSSLTAFRVAARLGSMLGRAIPVEEVLRARTPMALAAALRRDDPESPPVVTLSSGGGPPLFVIHPPGGGVADYLPLAEGLEDAVSVLGLVHPWLAGAGTTTGHDLAAAHAATIRATAPAGPWLLGGWSAGGLLAFQVARHLGAAAAGLLLLDAPAPGMLAMPGESGLLEAFAESLLGPTDGELPLSPSEDPWAAFVLRARQLDVLPEEGAEAALRLRFEAFCDTLRTVTRVPGGGEDGPLALPTILVAARSGALARRDLVDAWRRRVAPLQILDAETDHFGVLAHDALEGVAGALRRRFPFLDSFTGNRRF